MLDQQLIRIIKSVTSDEIDRVDRSVLDGIVDAVEGQYASVRIGDPDSDPVPNFYVDPALLVKPGDHVLAYRSGGFQLVTAVLNRNAVQTLPAWQVLQPFNYGAKGDGVTADGQAIQRMIDAAPDGGRVLIPDGYTFAIERQLLVSKSLHIYGSGTLKCVTAGLTEWLTISADDWSVEGVRFDDNQLGQTIIKGSGSRIQVTGCYFTGYSNAYGTPGSSDSAVRLTVATQARIVGNLFNKCGYGATNLNRCITLNPDVEDVVIASNSFVESSQGIIVSGNTAIRSLTITGNTFRDIKDNCIYLLAGVAGGSITGNTFTRTAALNADEALVMVDTTNVVIAGNTFRDIPNKGIAYDGACARINIQGNTFIKNDSVAGKAGAAIKFRNTTDTLVDSIISGNVASGDYFAEVGTFQLRNLSRCIVSGNRITMDLDTVDSSLIRMEGVNVEVALTDNMLQSTGTGAVNSEYGIRMDPVTSFTGIIARNRYINCSLRASGLTSMAGTMMADEFVDNANNRSTSGVGRIFRGAAAPTTGNWLQGDMVFNTAPAAAGVLGWVCTTAGSPGTWKTFGAIAA